MTESRGHWYNYKTGKYDNETPVNFADYIPQSPSHQGLYDCYLARGESPLEAVIKVLRQAVGFMVPTPQPGVMIPSNHDECACTPKITQAPGLTRFGTYNALPEPSRAITVPVFSKHITREIIVGTESRQPSDLDHVALSDLGRVTLKIFWLAPGNSVGVSRRNSVRHGWQTVFWFFGCEHKLVERPPTQEQRDLIGDHVHVYVCEHCGYELAVDSSG